MEILTDVFEGIGAGFTTYAPQVMGGIYQMFIHVFCDITVAEGVTTVNGLNELGYLAVGLLSIAIVSGLVATVLGFLKLRKRGSKKSNRRKRA